MQQFAIIGKQQQATALQVKASHILEALIGRRQVVVNRAATLRVGLGAYATGRLMEHDGRRLARELCRLTVNQHTVGILVHLMAEVLDRFTVHLHATFFNQGVRSTAAGNSTQRDKLIDSHKATRILNLRC